MVPFLPLEASWTSHDARMQSVETITGVNVRVRSLPQ